MPGIGIHCIPVSILKQCWSVGYVSLLTLSFYIWIEPKVEIRMTIDFYFSLMVTEKMMSCDLSQSNI